MFYSDERQFVSTGRLVPNGTHVEAQRASEPAGTPVITFETRRHVGALRLKTHKVSAIRREPSGFAALNRHSPDGLRRSANIVSALSLGTFPSFCKILLSFLLLSLIVSGCDRSSTKKGIEGKETVSKESKSTTKETVAAPSILTVPAVSNPAARSKLESCIAQYKRFKSYEDRGVLSIRIPTSGSSAPRVIMEPMRIAFETPNRLAIQVRGLKTVWSPSNTWEAVVSKEDVKPFGMQRLVRPLPDAIDLTWLIVDNLGPLLNDPVVGSPFHLQLLFDEKPLAYLLEPSSIVTLLEPAVFDSIKCDRVQIVSKELKWVFWIDQENQLLRKYEIPVQGIEMLVPGLPADFDPTKAELSIELVGAKANASVDWSGWQIPNQQDEIPVRRFIDAPPRNTPVLVGRILKQFDLFDANNQRILDSAQRTKPITVLCWIKNDAMSEMFVKFLFEIQRELEKRKLNNGVEIVLVSQEKPLEMQEALKKWNCTLPLAIDSANLTQKDFLIKRQPAYVVIDKQVRVQHFDEFGYLGFIPNIVEDIQRGVDIASRRLQLAIHDEARYNSRLHRVMMDKSQTEKLPPIDEFPFAFHESKEMWHTPFSESIIAAGSEHFYPQVGQPDGGSGLFTANSARKRVMTVLDENGNVFCIDNFGLKTLVATLPTEQAANPKRLHVLPDPWTHRWIAIVPEGLPRFWLIDGTASTSNGPTEATQYDLDENETPRTFAWTVKDGIPSLTVATSASKLRVLDPQTQKRFSSSTTPIASIVPIINDRGECVGWNAIKENGEIEELLDFRSSSFSSTGVEQLKRLTFSPQVSGWEWGSHHKQGVLLGLATLPSGEVGTILQTRSFEPLLRHPLSVRPAQCRVLSSTRATDGTLYWLSTAPNRVLHLQTADGLGVDQMCLGKRIVGAGIYPDEKSLRVVFAVDTEVNSWLIALPEPPASSSSENVSAPEPVGAKSPESPRA